MSKRRTARKPGSNACCRELGEMVNPKFFRALGDPNRVALLVRLAACRRPCTVGEISACCPIHVSVASRHLAMLRDAGILEAKRQGKEVFYSVRFDVIVPTLRGIADAIEACCPGGRCVPGACKEK